jgi:hypothetical protein
MKRFYLAESNDIDASSLDANFRLDDMLAGELRLADCGEEFDDDLLLADDELDPTWH